jgi:hypothetical protein
VTSTHQTFFLTKTERILDMTASDQLYRLADRTRELEVRAAAMNTRTKGDL